MGPLVVIPVWNHHVPDRQSWLGRIALYLVPRSGSSANGHSLGTNDVFVGSMEGCEAYHVVHVVVLHCTGCDSSPLFYGTPTGTFSDVISTETKKGPP